MDLILNNLAPTLALARREGEVTGQQTQITEIALQAIENIVDLDLLPQQNNARELNELADRLNEIHLEEAVEEAPVQTPQDVFWGLGNDWWRQLIDGRFHQYGRLVFDQGLHGGAVEPGFYESAGEACQFASNHVMESPTVDLYQGLHRVACRHFAGAATQTLMSASGAGSFISPIERGLLCRGDLSSLFRASSARYEEIERQRPGHKRNLQIGQYLLHESDLGRKQALLQREGITFQQAVENYYRAITWLNTFDRELHEKLDAVNYSISLKSQLLGLGHPIAILSIDPENAEKILVRYQCTREEVEQVVQDLFIQYEQKMIFADSREEKLRNIAELFQMLDWLHPFNDGQGRTDLILLAKELCRHGFNPAILDEPFFSTFSTLDHWVVYLERGMEKWREFRNHLHFHTN